MNLDTMYDDVLYLVSVFAGVQSTVSLAGVSRELNRTCARVLKRPRYSDVRTERVKPSDPWLACDKCGFAFENALLKT